MKKILVQTCIAMGTPFYCYILCWFINGFRLEYWFAVCTKETIDAIKGAWKFSRPRLWSCDSNTENWNFLLKDSRISKPEQKSQTFVYYFKHLQVMKIKPILLRIFFFFFRQMNYVVSVLTARLLHIWNICEWDWLHSRHETASHISY